MIVGTFQSTQSSRQDLQPMFRSHKVCRGFHRHNSGDEVDGLKQALFAIGALERAHDGSSGRGFRARNTQIRGALRFPDTVQHGSARFGREGEIHTFLA